MSAGNFKESLRLVLKHEGGYVDHPKDPGGATNLGVTIGTLSGWLGRPATKAEVRKLTAETVAPIYRKQYWDRVWGDDLPKGLDYAVFDFAVNSGPSKAVKSLQAALGMPKKEQDGAMGLNTLRTVRAANADAVIVKLCDGRLAWLKRLKTWGTFGRGWGSRVAGVKKAALAMTGDEIVRVSVKKTQDDEIGSARADPSDESMLSSDVGTAGALTGAGVTGSGVTQIINETAGQVSGLTPYLEVAKWVFVALLVIGAGLGIYAAIKRSRSAD